LFDRPKPTAGYSASGRKEEEEDDDDEEVCLIYWMY
jgi:hypothetical protein